MTDFYLRPLWSKYPPYFLYFVTLKGFVYNREIILAALLRHDRKTNMTKNRDKIVKSWYFKKKKKNRDMIFLLYRLHLLVMFYLIVLIVFTKLNNIWRLYAIFLNVLFTNYQQH